MSQNDSGHGTEEITITEVDAASVTEVPTPEPVEITVAVGDNVKIRGTVVSVEDDAVTIEIEDGIENNIHRITLNSRQAAVALKK